MQEHKIISTILGSRDAYLKLSAVAEDHAFSEFGLAVYREIVDFYETDPSIPYVDRDIIQTQLLKKHPKKEGLIQDYLASLPAPSSADNILRLYNDQKREKIKEELIIALSAGHDNKINSLVEEYNAFEVEEDTRSEEIYNATSVEELEVHFTGKNLIPIYPSALSDAIGGGVPRQSQIGIFAPPDVGKTTIAINATVGAAEKGFRALYIGNEDPPAKMVFRILTRFTRRTETELRRDPKGSLEIAISNGYKNFFFKPMHPGTGAEVRKWVERLKPDVVVIDQIRNMEFKSESMTQNLEAGCIFMRNLAKEFNFVSIVVTQAGDSAIGKTVLHYDDVQWSNIGVAATMDFMIGGGQTQDMKEQGIIMLSFPKNKFTAPIRPIIANIQYALNRITVNQ
jgi:hypothetical protein